VFGYFDPHGRQIKNLALLNRFNNNLFQRSLAMFTALNPIHFHPVRMAYRLQGSSIMPRLPTAFLAVAFAQTLVRWFTQSITGGRFTADTTILRQPVFQDFYSLAGENQIPVHRLNEVHNGVFALTVNRTNFCFTKNFD
jgi:hypothetical protein